jgi:(2R)-3-sulfolactate dehydrogenase (NADP+)
MTGTSPISSAELVALITQALTASRTSEANARSVAKALTAAETDGQKGHGVSRVPLYAAQARAGKVDGFATPQVHRTRPGALMIDVAHGFAYPAFDLAIGLLPELARGTGIAAAGFTRSHHFGVAGHAVERLVEHGLVALVVGNTPAAMAAWGGKRPLFGTNPIAFAAPRRGSAPVVIDLALSVAARGKILQASQKGEPIPQDWAFDATGRPTTDSEAALNGTLRPVGGAKGAALAFMVEVMAAALTASTLDFEASSFLDDKGPPPGVGQFLIAIDPGAFGGGEAFLDRIGALAEAIAADPGARLPGSRRLEAREKAAREGIAVDSRTLDSVRALVEPKP